jgi:hypothetical protein
VQYRPAFWPGNDRFPAIAQTGNQRQHQFQTAAGFIFGGQIFLMRQSFKQTFLSFDMPFRISDGRINLRQKVAPVRHRMKESRKSEWLIDVDQAPQLMP